MSLPFTIAIDGPAAAGKGTISKAVAEQFGFAHLDTGLLYRAVGAIVEETGRDPAEVARALDPAALSRNNRRFHKQLHLASHNRYLVQQLDLLYRSMALMATTSLAAEGRGEIAQAEHDKIVSMIEARDEEGAEEALKSHISVAFVTRLKQEATRLDQED